MRMRDFRQAGHWPTLLAAFLYFDLSFMVWVTLGPLMVYISRDLGLPVEAKFSLVAVPVLAGAILRIVLGLLSDRIGSKTTGLAAQVLVIAALAWAWQFGLHSERAVQWLGTALGLAGASFAVALPQASRWYPPRYQGLVMGIAGAGNLGVVVDSLLAPWLAQRYGWQATFGFLLIPLVLCLLFYAVVARDAPGALRPVGWRTYRRLLRDQDSWLFMFFYFITFGGFVGLGNALSLYFTVQYHVSGVAAGLMVALVVLFGSCFRPVGGHLADRSGGIRALSVLFAIVSAAYLAIAFLPAGPAPAGLSADPNSGWQIGALPPIAWAAVGLFSCGALALGMGNGAVFQLIPQRFRHEIGTMTGLVGCAGGVGGFLLARTLGTSQAVTGNFAAGFVFFSILAAAGWLGLAGSKSRWRSTWGAVSGARI